MCVFFFLKIDSTLLYDNSQQSNWLKQKLKIPPQVVDLQGIMCGTI